MNDFASEDDVETPADPVRDSIIARHRRSERRITSVLATCVALLALQAFVVVWLVLRGQTGRTIQTEILGHVERIDARCTP